jgi:hypothetical protein
MSIMNTPDSSDANRHRTQFRKKALADKLPVNTAAGSRCRDCMSDLNDGAKRCHKCGSFQNWQGRIQSGQIIFSFVLLLLTLTTLGPVKRLLLGNKAELHSSIVTADSERIWVVVSNNGNGTAILESIFVNVNKKGNGAWDNVLSFRDFKSRTLKPGQIEVISIPHNHQIPQIVEPGVTSGNKDCFLGVNYYEVAGLHAESGDTFRCHLDRNQ